MTCLRPSLSYTNTQQNLPEIKKTSFNLKKVYSKKIYSEIYTKAKHSEYLSPNGNPKRPFINSAKAIYSLACTIFRIMITSPVLPIAYAAHRYNVKYQHNAIVSLQRHSFENPNSSADAVTDLFCQRLDVLKYKTREDVVARKLYFDTYSQHVSDIFSNARYGGSKYCDPHLVQMSRESYINLNLVYRFDGVEMIGREVTFFDEASQLPIKYRVDRYFEDTHKQGLVGYGLIPVDNTLKAPPRLIFRGTCKHSFIDSNGTRVKQPTGMLSDFAGKIGAKAYLNQKDEIRDWLNAATKNGSKAFVSGHSLGGAMAQRVALDNLKFVGEVFTLNAPRLEKEAFKVKDNIEKRSERLKQVRINHVVMGEDFVPYAGGSRFVSGSLLSNGKVDNVTFLPEGKHTSAILNKYLLNKKDVFYRRESVSALLKRDWLWAGVINFMRPNINFR